MPAFLGLTGLPGSGKSTTANLVGERLSLMGFRTLSTSLSEELRIRLNEIGILAPGREELTAYANHLRDQYGAGILACYVLERANRFILQERPPIDLVVIDSIRNPAEIIEFRDRLGSRFRLLALLSSAESIKQRFTSGAEVLDVETMLASELGQSNPRHGVRVADCIDLADWTIENSGSDTQLLEQVDSLVAGELLPMIVLEHDS